MFKNVVPLLHQTVKHKYMTRVYVRYESVPEELKHLLKDEGFEECYEGDEYHLVQMYSLPEVINLTPHAINVVGYEEIPAAGLVPRVAMQTKAAGLVAGMPTTSTHYGKVEGLPEKMDDVSFIVSKMVKDACPDREDLLYPAELVRDDKGNIVGCKSLGL